MQTIGFTKNHSNTIIYYNIIEIVLLIANVSLVYARSYEFVIDKFFNNFVKKDEFMRNAKCKNFIKINKTASHLVGM